MAFTSCNLVARRKTSNWFKRIFSFKADEATKQLMIKSTVFEFVELGNVDTTF